LEVVRAKNQQLQIELGNLEAEREKLSQELASVRSQFEKERADRKQVEAELAELKQKLAAANKDLPDATDVKQESARTSDLSDKAAKVVSFFRPLLNKKAPTNLLSKVEEILEES
jgi:uncharacterized protein (DUF3084 family)